MTKGKHLFSKSRVRRAAAGTLAAITATTSVLALTSTAEAQEAGTTTRIPCSGEMTDDGRYFFRSLDPSNIDPSEPSGLYVCDRLTGAETPVSEATTRTQVRLGGVSGDGRWVHYSLPNGNGRNVSYLLDRRSGERVRTSWTPEGRKGFGEADAVSNDGRIVLTGATVRNVARGRTKPWNVGLSGKPRGKGSWEVTLNAGNGRYVAFTGRPRNAPSGNLRDPQVWVHDRVTGKTQNVSRAKGGGYGNGESRNVTLSANGRYAGFTSAATNLTRKDGNGVGGVFVRDLKSGAIRNVNESSTGQKGDRGASSGSRYDAGDVIELSATGRYVAFWSFASNLVPGDTNERPDLFIRDREDSAVSRVNVTTAGAQSESGYASEELELSRAGRFVSFPSQADDLTPDDPVTPPGGAANYLRERG